MPNDDDDSDDDDNDDDIDIDDDDDDDDTEAPRVNDTSSIISLNDIGISTIGGQVDGSPETNTASVSIEIGTRESVG